MTNLIFIMLIAIPVTAIIDYFAFRDRFKKEMGDKMSWHYFLIPCALECGCFIAGYLIGSGGL